MVCEGTLTGDPHLRRRKGVHPGDQANAVLGIVRLPAESVIASGVVTTGLKTTFTGVYPNLSATAPFPANAAPLS